MHCIIQGVKIIDPASPHHLSVKDIRIVNGIIVTIGTNIQQETGDVMIPFHGKCISPGWFDMLAAFGDPGHEYKETLESGAAAAAYGGFTGVCIMPVTDPALHSKAEIEYVINRSKGNIVNIFPYGAVTKDRSGISLTEMYDMHEAGAIAFTDADEPIKDAGILLRSLLYVKPFNGVIVDIPGDHTVVGNANVNEGLMSVQLGMYGIPDVLEELSVIRNIKLAAYTESRMHLGVVSSAKSLSHIREAKKAGVQVTAGVSAAHLYFDESELHDYNTHFKLNPPLRTADDRAALIAALADGTIDVICSYHLPHENDAKDVEFEYASFGMESLEAVSGAVGKSTGDQLSLTQRIEKMAIRPREILGIRVPVIAVGEAAECTIFDDSLDWTFTAADIKSQSSNSGFINKQMRSKALAIINHDQIKLL